MNTDSPAGMMMKFASETTKPFVDDYLLSAEAREAVKHGYLHIHDKDYYPTKSLTCVQHPSTGYCAMASQPATARAALPNASRPQASYPAYLLRRPRTRCTAARPFPLSTSISPHSCAHHIRRSSASSSPSTVARSNISTTPPSTTTSPLPLDGLEGDDRIKQHAINLTAGRVHQAMEAFIHNMNTIHSRGGNQVVFSSINYGTDTSAEGRCIIRELLNSTYEGVGNGATAIFPIQIWKKNAA